MCTQVSESIKIGYKKYPFWNVEPLESYLRDKGIYFCDGFDENQYDYSFDCWYKVNEFIGSHKIGAEIKDNDLKSTACYRGCIRHLGVEK